MLHTTFENSEITTLPTIPESVVDMTATFSGCGNLDFSELVISENVEKVSGMVGYCTSVTGAVKLPCRFMGQSVQDELGWMEFTGTIEYYHIEGCSH